MQARLSFAIIFITALAGAAVAQSVTVTSKKVTYTRPKPMIDFKRTFTVEHPQVKAATPALSRKIQNAISFETVIPLDIKEEMNDVQWLEEATFEVNYNKKGLLAVTLTVQGTGAYPSSSSSMVVVNTRTGVRLHAADVFSNQLGLARLVKAKQADEIAKAVDEIRNDPDIDEENPEELFSSADFTASDLDRFLINDDGITFYYDYGFPHVIMALQPPGEFAVSWDELRPFIKRTGPLAVFLK